MTTPTPLADRVRSELAGRDVREVRMFGGLSFMVDGAMLVAVRGDAALLVRIDPADHAHALDRGASRAFMGHDRPMGEGWVSVAADHLSTADDLRRWLGLAFAARER